jgi:hypothetical protein
MKNDQGVRPWVQFPVTLKKKKKDVIHWYSEQCGRCPESWQNFLSLRFTEDNKLADQMGSLSIAHTRGCSIAMESRTTALKLVA